MNNPFKMWKSDHVYTSTDLQEMIADFERDKPTVGAFDTETTGLHIKKDKPFLIQFGWLVPNTNFGRVYTFETKKEFMEVFFRLAKQLKYLVAHNASFDCHMLSNIGYEEVVQSMTNLVDNTNVARLALEAVSVRDGGDALQLKKLGEKYVHPDATRSESLIKEDLRRLENERIKVLTAALRQFDHPDEVIHKPIRKDTGRPTTAPYARSNPDNVEWKWVPKKWGKKLIEDFLKDPTNDVDLLPDDVQEVWRDWQEEYPKPTYEDVDRDLMIKYGGEDIITTLEFFKKAYAYLVKRDQLPILEIEQRAILPIFRMERVGLKADLDYLEESRKRVQNYIRKQREEMIQIAGEVVTVNQHTRIKAIYEEKWGIVLESSDSPSLGKVVEKHTGEPKRFAELVRQLRTLEKWYSTYIKRTIANASYDGKVYTQINTAGAISGRMSSDLQQVPKDPILDEEGNELFYPRKAFIVDKDQFELNAYIDFSQVELRVTAHYTLLVMGGDVNLCRAYIPFRCKHYKTGAEFPYKDIEERKRWNEKQPNGDSAWLLEDGSPWTPTDMHSETTHNMLLLLGYECLSKYKQYRHKDSEGYFGKDIDEKRFKRLRSMGKTYNFSKTYGVGIDTTMKNLDISREVAEALSLGYTKSFPGIIDYNKMISRVHAQRGYVRNHYGMRYYLEDTSKSYKLGNYVIQGGCALGLKMAIIALDDYIIKNNLKSRLILPVHDEQIFGIARGEKEHIMEYVNIMESDMNTWCLIPIIAEPEVSYDTWANAEEYKED